MRMRQPARTRVAPRAQKFDQPTGRAAASIGGGRSYRQRTPVGWYSILLGVCIIGLGLIVFSRHERQVRLATSSTTTSTTQADTRLPC